MLSRYKGIVILKILLKCIYSNKRYEICDKVTEYGFRQVIFIILELYSKHLLNFFRTTI